MSTTSQITADELLQLPDGMGRRYELVAGELRTMPLHGWRHGEVVDNVATRLGVFIHENSLGIMLAGGTGFILERNPHTVRAPNYAFLSKEHFSNSTIGESYWPGAPDLAIEVLSADDRVGQVDEKI